MSALFFFRLAYLQHFSVDWRHARGAPGAWPGEPDHLRQSLPVCGTGQSARPLSLHTRLRAPTMETPRCARRPFTSWSEAPCVIITLRLWQNQSLRRGWICSTVWPKGSQNRTLRQQSTIARSASRCHERAGPHGKKITTEGGSQLLRSWWRGEGDLGSACGPALFHSTLIGVPPRAPHNHRDNFAGSGRRVRIRWPGRRCHT